MKKLITLFLLMIIINANIKSQSKAIRIGGDCMLENSVILSEVLFALDSLFIQDMYDENCKLLLFASIDSEGNLINIDTNLTLKRSNVIFRDSLLQRMEEYIKSNNIKSVTVARMIVPCCGGIEYAAKKALEASGKNIPINVVTIATDGNIV